MFTSMGIDSIRWIAIICGLLLISFFTSCSPQSASDDSVPFQLSENLQIDGYGHIDDTAVVDVENEPLTCSVLDEEPANHVCNDGKVWLCHSPPGNPLNAHMIKVSLNAVKKGHTENHEGDYTVPCSDEYQEAQNCPLLDCYLNDGEGYDQIDEIILTEEQVKECLDNDIRTRSECREYWSVE